MDDVAILMQDVRKSYGKVKAIDGVSMSIAAGEVLALLGPNGAGKTTAVRIMTTAVAPDSGRAQVLGLDTVRQAAEVRHHIGLVGQFAAVDLKLTGRENLRLIGRLTRVPRGALPGRVDELIERFALQEVAERQVRTYSGGTRRRLDVAAALVHRPRVLFLDEPTTGLDPVSRNELWSVVETLVADGATAVLTTQYLQEADRRARRIAVLNHGRVIASGTSAELKARLRSAVVDLSFAEEQDAVRAAGELGRDSDRLAAAPARDGVVVTVPAEAGADTVAGLIARLKELSLVPSALALREPSLDEVFQALTGDAGEKSGEIAADNLVPASGGKR
jgi:daunorubicin resistance ABC transporter ATP-binding subunit